MDVKIASKAITLRLEKVLSDLISADQCPYVKGRNIFDAVRTIGDIMDYTKLYNLPGLTVTIDFEKAFDSLSWNFLFKTLEKFNFGEFALFIYFSLRNPPYHYQTDSRYKRDSNRKQRNQMYCLRG